MHELKKVVAILSLAERKKFAWLALVIFVMGLLEVVGVVSILPFIKLVADPGIVDRHRVLYNIYHWLHFSSQRQMLIWAGVAVIVLLLLTNAFSVFKTWLQFRISWSVAHHVSMRLLQTYLGRPYEYFLRRNTTEFTANVIGETTNFTNGVVLPLIEIFSRGLVSLIIFGLLVWVDSFIALVMFGFLGAAYLIIYFAQRTYLRHIGELRMALVVKRYKNLQEMFAGIKTVQVFNRQAFFADRYEAASLDFCDIQPKYNVVVASPRYILEVLAFGAIVGITIYLYLTEGNIAKLFPKLSLYAVAGYRLLPALQSAFAAVGKFVHNYPVIDKLYAALYADHLPQEVALQPPRQVLTLHETITLHNVNFTYEGNEQATLRDISLTIRRGETVAFVGTTGSGKTTLVDLIVGLLQPSKGTVCIDGRALASEQLAAWRSSVAYVPQDVFLFDDSVARNITLREGGITDDQYRLDKATQLADIHRFIQEELPAGYATQIGEKGVRLSGGQRQRLGLARAFYHRPSVLILDEATSALDNLTERGIIHSLQELPEGITTILIAHRLSTVRYADRIFLLDDGRLVASGTYEELLSQNDLFKNMAQTY